MEGKSAATQWRAAFNEQATDSIMELVLNYTRSLSRQIEARTGQADWQSPEDRVHAAVLGTLDGRFRWEPERGELAPHLMWAVKRGVFHEQRRAARFPHVSIDDDGSHPTERELSDAIESGRDMRVELVQSVFTTWATQVRTLAAGDRAVLRLLAAYDEGAFGRQEVMATARMSARTYHRALQQLKRLTQQLPNEMQDMAIDAIAGGDLR